VQELCKFAGKNSPEEILRKITEAVSAFSSGQPKQDDQTAAILQYLVK
jgi:serine phosphatase RsbU (regulator of sigma subunit)